MERSETTAICPVCGKTFVLRELVSILNRWEGKWNNCKAEYNVYRELGLSPKKASPN